MISTKSLTQRRRDAEFALSISSASLRLCVILSLFFWVQKMGFFIPLIRQIRVLFFFLQIFQWIKTSDFAMVDFFA